MVFLYYKAPLLEVVVFQPRLQGLARSDPRGGEMRHPRNTLIVFFLKAFCLPAFHHGYKNLARQST